MTIQFQFRGVSGDEPLRRRLRADLEGLRAWLPVLSAQVGLERQPGAALPYQASAALVVEGPGVCAAARDHAWPAAWEKVMRRLRQQIEARRRPQPGRAGGRSRHRTRAGAQAARRA